MCLQSVQISHLYTSLDGYFSKDKDGMVDGGCSVLYLAFAFLLRSY